MELAVRWNDRCHASLQIECMRCFFSAVVSIYHAFHNKLKDNSLARSSAQPISP
jgi:hypothetical protein